MIYRQLDGNIGELRFYGEISEWWISGEDFTRTLQEMEGKFSTIHIRAHCYGGSVFEGNVMYNAILRCKSKTIVYIDGVSASMMTIVMQAADEIVIAENGWVMVHCPIGYERGNAKQMFQCYKLLTGMEKNFAKTYARKTGKSEKDVEAWFDGADHWLNAEEAKAEGLVTRIEEPVVANVVQLDKPTDNGQEETVFGRFAALLSADPSNNDKHKKEDCNMKKELIAKFGLTGVTEASTDAEITAAMQAKLDGVTQTSQKVVDESVEAIIASMEKATGKNYEASVRTSLVTVGKTSGLTVLQAMLGINVPSTEPAASAVSTAQSAQPAAVPQVVSLLNNNSTTVVAEDRKSWNWDKWQEEDSDGIETMEKTDPEAFKKLYHAKYGVIPVL